MRRILWAAFLAAILTSCAHNYLTLGVGADRHLERGTNPRSVIRFSSETDPGCWPAFPKVICFIEYNHHSSFREGMPFNDRPEELTDQLSIGIKVPLWTRK